MLATTALSALALASPAAAQDTKWSEGELVYGIGPNCTSIIFGGYTLENQTAAFASQQVPVDGLPHTGDVFYARISFGSIGDICSGGGHALPEFLPPHGVEFVREKRYPPYWTVYDEGTEKRGSDDDYPVVRVDPSGRSAQVSVFDHTAKKTAPWPFANSGGSISVHVAMRARRRLNGIGSAAPDCPQRENGVPCPVEESGDHLQILTRMSAGAPANLVPYVGLFAREPRAPSVAVRATVRARGFTVRARTAPRLRVKAFVLRGRRAVAAAQGRADARGRVALALRGRRGRAVVRVVAVGDDGASSLPATRRIRLR